MTDAAATAAGPSTRSRLRLGSCPDSWGVWFADDPGQTPWQRFLDELAEAGYRWLELGPYGYLPTDPARLRDEVDRRGLQVSGQAVFGALHDRDKWETDLRDAHQVAELVTAMGASHVVLLPAGYRDLDGTWLGPRELDEDAWRTLVDRTAELGWVLRDEHGLKAVFHPLAETDPDDVNLCLDTGHIAYYEGDNVELIRRYPDRIAYLHMKQADPAIVAQVRAEDLWFAEAVRRGVMCEPPHGDPEVEALLAAVDQHLDGELFMIVEQDLYPCDPDDPLPIATRTCKYLRQLGVGSDAQ
jgi:inosose dehydratase